MPIVQSDRKHPIDTTASIGLASNCNFRILFHLFQCKRELRQKVSPEFHLSVLGIIIH